MDYFELCQSVLKELCVRTNALLVIDDFGAGFSNLERLILLEPAIVKLDLALTHDIHRVSRKQIVAHHMINLCKDLGAKVVAEGVETLDELICVRDLGVDFVQGYLLARPATPPPTHVWPLGATSPSSRRKEPPPLPVRKGPPPLPSARPQASPGSVSPLRRTPSGRITGPPTVRKSRPPR